MILDGSPRLVASVPELAIKQVTGGLDMVASAMKISAKEAPDTPFKDGVVVTENFYVSTFGEYRINDYGLNAIRMG